MANTNINTALEIYSDKVIEGLTTALPALRQFSVDLSADAKQPGAVIRVPLVAADTAAPWDISNNNYAKSAATLKDKKVEIATRIIAGFGITQEQLANFAPHWWEGKAALNAAEVANSVLTTIFGLVTAEAYGDTAADKITVAAASFGRKAVAELRPKVVAKKLNPSRSVLVLNPDFFAALLSDLDAHVYGGREAITGGVIPGLLGFRSIIEAPQYTGPGFVCHPDAIAVASRAVQVADTTPYKEFGAITEPTTGLTLNRVLYTAGDTGTTTLSIECLFGADVGNEKALVRLVA